jgi:hypothetical protein
MTEAERKGIVDAVLRHGALAALAVDHALTEMADIVESSRDAAIAAEQRAEKAEAALGEAVTFLEGWDRSFEIARLGIANWPLESADLPRTKVHREVRDVLEAIRSRAPAVERYRLLVALARRVREKMCGLDVADDAYSIELYAMAMSALRAGDSPG